MSQYNVDSLREMDDGFAAAGEYEAPMLAPQAPVSSVPAEETL